MSIISISPVSFANLASVFWASPKFHSWFTGGVLRTVRTLSHWADSRRGGIVDMRSRDVSRSAISDSLAVVAANDGRAGRRTTPAAAAADAERRRARRDDGGRSSSSSSSGAHAMTRSEGSSIDDDDNDDDAPARD
jgi:hypothetical protein